MKIKYLRRIDIYGHEMVIGYETVECEPNESTLVQLSKEDFDKLLKKLAELEK